MKPPEVFATKRLLLRPPKISDAEAIFIKYAQDPEVTRYLIWSPHTSIEQTHEFLQYCESAWDTGKAFPWVIIRKSDLEILGMVELRVKGHIADVGYVLAKAYWGRGYMTEAVEAVVRWAISQPKVYRVWAVCDKENIASARVMEKVGMQREGLLRRYIVHPNVSDEPRDCWCYSVTK